MGPALSKLSSSRFGAPCESYTSYERYERYKHLISVPALNFESILKRAPRAVVEAHVQVHWACPSRKTANPCLCMDRDGPLAKFDPAHGKYRRSHESCWMEFGSTVALRFCCYCLWRLSSTVSARNEWKWRIRISVHDCGRTWGGKVRERAIHPRCGDWQCDYWGLLKHLYVDRHKRIPCVVATRNVRD